MDAGYVDDQSNHAPTQPGHGAPPPPQTGYGAAPPPQTGHGAVPPPQTGYGQQQPLRGQPQGQAQAQWMEKPQGNQGCPPGLEYLTMVDQLLIHQQIELLEVFTSWETSNRYAIKNSMGQQIYFAAEESDTCHRQCCGPLRGFAMHITDNNNQEVMRVNREFKCCAGNSWCAGIDCCAMTVSIEAPPGQIVGYVKQAQSCMAPKYKILDAQENVILLIEGPVCICQGPCCTKDQEFQVFSADMSSEVGKISKQWSGLVREMFTTADNFGITFPMDLDVKCKAAMIGGLFLIDFMYFENKDKNNSIGI